MHLFELWFAEKLSVAERTKKLLSLRHMLKNKRVVNVQGRSTGEKQSFPLGVGMSLQGGSVVGWASGMCRSAQKGESMCKGPVKLPELGTYNSG